MNQYRARLFFIAVLLMAGAVAIIIRLFTIQILDNQRYATRSRDQTQQRRILPAKRGNIYDRKGTLLASSMESAISVNLDVSQSGNSKPAAIGRVYPFGEIGGPLLGYVGKDGYGLGGVEFSFDKYLRGEDGWIILQKDGRNERYRKIGLPFKEPRNGHDVYLTIDNNIQKIAQTVIRQTVHNLKAKGGMCIVMDPSDGKILAMVNEPSFNPNFPSNYSLISRQNKCISNVYEPGSTFKIITAAAALQDNIMKEQDLIYGNKGVFEIYHQVIRDHSPYGYLTFENALAYSSNVCFAKISNDVGNERLYRFTRDFGFGAKCGIELPGEEAGILHPVKSWSGRTRVTMAMGQEISVTLLQMILPFVAVANGGVLVTPEICEKVVNADNEVVKSFKYRPVRRVLSEDIAQRLRTMMKKVVDSGTGKNAAIEGVSVAGKTGTSQKPDSGTYSKIRSWSSFIGFVPVEKPALVCAVMIDEPLHGEMGGVAAAPAFKKIMTQIISHPELEYAEKVLRKNTAPFHNNSAVRIPQMCGLPKDSAVRILNSYKMKYRFFGNGKTITYQSLLFNDEGESPVIALYLDNSEQGLLKKEIPYCVGRDLRDAINMINLSGIKPYAIGAGTVRRQSPPAGAEIEAVSACTLYCSFDG
jgi:cell division protein FtsI/penicillin-binding protein 2